MESILLDSRTVKHFFMESEGERFKQARKALGLSLEDVAATTEYSVSTISGIENGHDRPSKRLRERLIQRLELNEAWLKSGKGDMFQQNTHGGWIKLANELHLVSGIEDQLMKEPEFLRLIERLAMVPEPNRSRYVKLLNPILDGIIASELKQRDVTRRKK